MVKGVNETGVKVSAPLDIAPLDIAPFDNADIERLRSIKSFLILHSTTRSNMKKRYNKAIKTF